MGGGPFNMGIHYSSHRYDDQASAASKNSLEMWSKSERALDFKQVPFPIQVSNDGVQ